MWSLTLRLREAGMATLCCIVATAQPPSHGSAAGGGWGVEGGGAASAPVSLWQAVTAAQRWIYKVASYSISRSCFYIENCLCHKQLMDEGGIVYDPCLPQLLYLFYLYFMFYWSSSYGTFTDRQLYSSSYLPFLCFSFCMCRFFLKFFLKCNQNCLKNAGNPRDMRRFQVRCNYLHACSGSNDLLCPIVRNKSISQVLFKYSLCLPREKPRTNKECSMH